MVTPPTIRFPTLIAGTLALFQLHAQAGVLGSGFDYTAYAEDDFEYVRIDFSSGSVTDIAPLTEDM